MGWGYRHRKTDSSSGGLHSETYLKKEQKANIEDGPGGVFAALVGGPEGGLWGPRAGGRGTGITGAAEHLGIN